MEAYSNGFYNEYIIRSLLEKKSVFGVLRSKTSFSQLPEEKWAVLRLLTENLLPEVFCGEKKKNICPVSSLKKKNKTRLWRLPDPQLLPSYQ